jgi:hypothetical protein
VIADTGHWDCLNGLPDPQQYHGFLYLIKDGISNRAYLGKKSYGGGKPWRSYTSSSKELNELIKEHGKDEFKFIMLLQVKTKGALTYLENRLLFLLDVVHHDYYYNRNIAGRYYPVQEILDGWLDEPIETAVQKLYDDWNEHVQGDGDEDTGDT